MPTEPSPQPDSQAPPRQMPPQGGLLAGVDEAGLGPILGPLVVAGVALEGPKGSDPWHLLKSVVSRNRNRTGRLRVADSKKVKQGKHGMKNLERTVLCFLYAATGALPKTLGHLLELTEVPHKELQRCPWYGDLSLPMPLQNDPQELELTGHRLARSLEKAQVQIRRIALRPVDVEEFNALIKKTDNKSDTHFTAYAEVIARLLQVLEHRSHLVADRCGGRVHYRTVLQRHFRKSRIQVMGERANLSRYRIRQDERTVEISFMAQGEDRSFPTALASCFAKYLREVMMESLNRWFLARAPGVKRTAGYYVDGHRFLGDVGHLPELDAETVDRLVRVR